jgi:hypothetical protein
MKLNLKINFDRKINILNKLLNKQTKRRTFIHFLIKNKERI